MESGGLTGPTNKSTPSDRVRRRRKTARPAEILAAGFAEFAEKGFMAARLEDVALRAGIAKGTIYLYYDSKQELFEAAVRARILPALGEATARIDEFEGPTGDLLRLVLRTFYARIGEPEVRTLLRIMIGEGHRFPDLLAFYHREFITRIVGLLRRVVDRGIARGEFHPGVATETPIVLMAPAIMGAIWQMTFASIQPVPLSAFEAAHADLLVSYLESRRPER